MSVVFVIVPVVAGGWPMISTAILAASAALGYRAVQSLEERVAMGVATDVTERAATVQLVMEDSQVVADTLARGESFTVEREGLRATFHRDGRGRCTVHVSGPGRTNAELEAAGRELMDRVRQQFAYAKVMAELEERGFDIVQEQVEADQSIRICVRRWS
jgi:Protein of unknown function (DUF1257)